jgi:hypothetical protein
MTGPTGAGLTYPLVEPRFTGQVTSNGPITLRNELRNGIYGPTVASLDEDGNIYASGLIFSSYAISVLAYGSITPSFSVDQNGDIIANSITTTVPLPSGATGAQGATGL